MNAIFDMIRYVTHNQASFEPGLVLIVFWRFWQWPLVILEERLESLNIRSEAI